MWLLVFGRRQHCLQNKEKYLNYTVKAKEQNYWRKHYNFPTIANGPAVCLRLALRCWLKKGTFTVRIITGKSKTAASEIYATGYGAW
jgi:hypothetical protein